MATKNKSANLIQTINEILITAQKRGIVHLYTEDTYLNGREITIKNQKLIHFGSCSYLGLETDQRLKDAGIDAIQRYGSQFSCSRTYLSFTLYQELEDLIGKMFKAPFLLSTSSTMGHDAVIPIVVEDNDCIILDHQAHYSMQDVARKLQVRGIPVLMLRHSRMDELEQKIKELSSKHNKIWYFCDGVYSMYGDLAPIYELEILLNKYPKLWLYCDDAHGMSWSGKYGAGSILNQIKHHHKMILATSLAKGFASAGGVFIFPNEELCNRVKHWGGPLTHSGPQQPAVIGASIASAKVHLSDEIYERQKELAKRIRFCNEVLKSYNVPLIAESESPIFFIGLGLTKVGYNMVKRLVDDGFYTNLGIFPAVPENCTGIRFTITLNHTYEDIEKLAGKIAYHLPKALKEEGRTFDDINRAFKLNKKKAEEKPSEATSLKIEKETTIHNVPQKVWDLYMGGKGSFDWNGLAFLENVYSGNKNPEHNWSFYYYFIKDSKGKIIAASFFTLALCKEDMFASENISRQIEERRKLNKYYLSSKTFMMGSLLTEGNHLYLDKSHNQWKQALMLLLDEVWKDQEIIKAEYLYLRDFDSQDSELNEFFMDQGFVKMNLPDAHNFENFNWENEEEYLLTLPGKKRNRIKREAISFKNCFEVKFISDPSRSDIDKWYQLYNNIKNKNLSINAFDIPEKFFNEVKNGNWDIMELTLKPEYDKREERWPVGIGFIYKAKDTYCPIVLGIDYNFMSFNIYRQMLFQAIMRAKSLSMKNIYFGFTATEDKQKFGIKPVSKCAYVQIKDNFNMSVINMMPNIESKVIV